MKNHTNERTHKQKVDYILSRDSNYFHTELQGFKREEDCGVYLVSQILNTPLPGPPSFFDGKPSRLTRRWSGAAGDGRHLCGDGVLARRQTSSPTQGEPALQSDLSRN
ncbi:hypothetical protein EVAR_28090_1 [Eumeta japonica]|uniref:Uncharacterized protein n=1 Tax=Eumeta variegata TaxID=151549 RepID=A0A4C1WC27_EUMVA|nr:hypothetical protein EVAR_28090_1 [Eumeta japonica]